MTEELKPCPFCESSAEAITYITESVVQCSNWDCGIGATRKELEDAISVWNRRA
jgi:hypothetical protein